jgi:hypothetical protein
MSKPENSFIAGIHKHLPVALHHEKMHNPYRGGTADVWYSGKRADLWIEYKYELLPARATTLIPIDLSALQKLWLARRSNEGRNVAVIVGCQKGGVLFLEETWLTPLRMDEFVRRIVSRKDLANWILQQTGGPP